MRYREIQPARGLRPFVNCFWMISAPQPLALSDRTLPDGCQEIVFNIDTRVLRRDGENDFHANPDVELVGQMSRPYELRTRGCQHYYGIKFFPHSFSVFTDEPIWDLRDQSIDLRLLFGDALAPLVDVAFVRPALEQFALAAERLLLQRLAHSGGPGRGYRLVDSAVRALFHTAGPRIESLCAALGVSERYLQQQFRRRVGLTPMQLLKMVRFQKSLHGLTRSRVSLTELAHRCGYSDQAHFSRDFRTLAGVSPSEYRRLETPLTGFFLGEESRAYLCGLG
ncbi:helix-turn-helix transcriptional regulator [Microbulbifer litoralis]|uniref:helix-turn-helix transcriptional regulator n=1 Tax=Microbulbifer litoralis TaxID=2933965 RepID=UPI00202865BE|nr:helix-turn-helix transcriptional regulator [Microbulbifer sp. GX H0434]